MSISTDETKEQGMKNISCVFKKSEDDTLENLYFADLMNNFEDYGYNELEYKTNYVMEQGDLILDIDHSNKQVDWDNPKSENTQQDSKSLHNELHIDLLLNEIIKQEIFYYAREFFDI